MRMYVVTLGIIMVCGSIGFGQTINDPVRDRDSFAPETYRKPGMYDLRTPPIYRPMPIVHYDEYGVRYFDSYAERDQKLKEESEERRKREEAMKAFSERNKAIQEKQSKDAEWKLGAIVIGLIFGLLCAIFGRK